MCGLRVFVWIFQQVASLAVTVHGQTEAHVGQRKGMLCLYGRMLAFHQTYLSHVMDVMGGEEWLKWKCTMSVWTPNSKSHSRACGRLAGKLINWIIFNLNKVRRKMLARGAWKHSMTKVMQLWIGSLEVKHEKFNEIVEKRTWPTGWELFEDSGMIPQTGWPNHRSGGQLWHH